MVNFTYVPMFLNKKHYVQVNIYIYIYIYIYMYIPQQTRAPLNPK